MNRCLDERALVALFYDRPTTSERPDRRAHLCACMDCARRYRRLCEDLAEVDAALDSPPPRAARATYSTRPRRWLPYADRDLFGPLGLRWAAAGLVAALAVFALASLPATESKQPRANARAGSKHAARIAAGFRNVSAAISASPRANDAAGYPIPTELAALQAALDGTDACGSTGPFDSEGCADDRLVLAPRWR